MPSNNLKKPMEIFSTEMTEKLQRYSDALESLKEKRKAIEYNRMECHELLSDNEVKYANTKEVREISQRFAEHVQTTCYRQLADLVSRCLSAVFDVPYKLELIPQTKANRMEIEIVLHQGDKTIGDPMNSVGGGVVDVVSMALRIAAMMLSRPQVNHIIIMDEPFRFVSVEYRPKIKSLIEMLASELNVQFVLVTHDEELQCGKVIRIE